MTTSLTKVNLKESTTLDFEVGISGSSETNPNIRLVVEASDFEIVVPGKYENNKFVATIPPLANIIEAGSHNVSMEVILEGDKYFVPFREQIEFVAPVEITAKAKAVSESVPSKISIGRVKIATKEYGITKTLTEQLKLKTAPTIDKKRIEFSVPTALSSKAISILRENSISKVSIRKDSKKKIDTISAQLN